MRFPKLLVASSLPESYIESEKQLKEFKWKKGKLLEDIKRDQALWDKAKFSFNKKKEEFLKFLADSSSYASQVMTQTYGSFLNATSCLVSTTKYQAKNSC